MSSELSTGKTIVILAVVIGCFAVLWPNVFYPMLTASVKPSTAQAPNFRDPANAHFLTQLCFLLREHKGSLDHLDRIKDDPGCLEEIKKSCKISLTEGILQNFRLSKDKTNLTTCLLQHYDLTVQKISSSAPPAVQSKPYTLNVPHPHTRPERPQHLHTEGIHPALREKGRTMPHRTIEKQARPGPMPGIRPPMGAGAHMVPPQTTKGTGAMSIIMPLYTVGIVVFFVYTIMKVMFKKGSDDEKAPKLKDFGQDPEYRKYVFAEEYLDSSNTPHRDILRRQERENSKHKRRHETYPDLKIEDEQMDQLRRRLEETESAMERLMSQMGSVTDKLTAAKITEVLTQAQTQAKILKEIADATTEDDMTTSEGFTLTLSEDFSLPLTLQRRLEEMHIKDMCMKGTLVDDELSCEQERASFDKDPGFHEEGKHDGLEHAKVECHPNVHDTSESSVKENDIKEMAPNNLGTIERNVVTPPQEVMSLDEPSDIAQHDDPGEFSDNENVSEASETGADISELKSYADDGPPPSVPLVSLPMIDETTPEAKYSATTEKPSDPNQNVYDREKHSPGIVLDIPGIEQSTQTEAAKKLSVIDLQTTYQLKDTENSMRKLNDEMNKIHEIILDATVPLDTQLLVQEAQVGSQPVENIEFDASDTGPAPCIVTSQVSLAFVGLEHNDMAGSPLTFIIPEQRRHISEMLKTREPDVEIKEEPPLAENTQETEKPPSSETSRGIPLDEKKDGELFSREAKVGNTLDHVSKDIIKPESKERAQICDKIEESQISKKDEDLQISGTEEHHEVESEDRQVEEETSIIQIKDNINDEGTVDKEVPAKQPQQVGKTSPSKINLDDYGSEEDASDDESQPGRKIMRSKTNPNEVLQIIERPGLPKIYRKIIYVEETDSEEESEELKEDPQKLGHGAETNVKETKDNCDQQSCQSQIPAAEPRLDKTGSLESADMEHELVANDHKPENIRKFIGQERPDSPVPPILPGDQPHSPDITSGDLHFIPSNSSLSNLQDESSELRTDKIKYISPSVRNVAEMLVTDTTLEAMNKLSEMCQTQNGSQKEDSRSPRGEDGPSSSKASSHDMEEYQVVSKEVKSPSSESAKANTIQSQSGSGDNTKCTNGSDGASPSQHIEELDSNLLEINNGSVGNK